MVDSHLSFLTCANISTGTKSVLQNLKYSITALKQAKPWYTAAILPLKAVNCRFNVIWPYANNSSTNTDKI